MTSPTLPAIQIRDLHYAYPPPHVGAAPVSVLRGVNLAVGAGEFVAVLGRVGAGKSTLCMALNGLVPHATGGAFRGEVTVLGRDTRKQPIADLARTVGLVFQDPEMQLTQMRAEDEIAFGPENLGVPAGEIEERVTWALEVVGLTGYSDRSPLHLSGGEKQRLAIAAMLAMRPQILVLDEPTANLDPAGKATVFNLVARLARERQITIVLATQEMERVARYARRAVVLHEGVIALDDTPAAVFAQADRLREWGLGAPQLAELASLLTRRAGRVYQFHGMGEAYAQLRAELKNWTGRPPASALTDASPDRAGAECFAIEAPLADDARAALRQAQEPVSEKSSSGALDRPEPTAAPQIHGAIAPERASQPQLALEQVSFSYPDGTPALGAVSLAVEAGEFVALLGANGSGKTTLAKHLNGLLKPTLGCVRVQGRDTRPLRVAELARHVGYVFQNPDHQIFASTVEEELAFGLRLQKLSSANVMARVNWALAEFDLAPYRTTPPALLGWGQRRQIAVAAVLATRPQALILDEPTGGLDARSRDGLLAAVTDFNRSGGTVILITHNMRLVAEYASRAVVMAGGQVVFDGAPLALFERRDILRRARLAAPAVVRLGQRLAPVGLEGGILSCAGFAAAWQRLTADRQEHVPMTAGRITPETHPALASEAHSVEDSGEADDGR
jgi:energy-coupling factor transport system ATP-binding protein